MGDHSPKISIVTATWNCKSTVLDCLNSVAGQTWKNREHIVVDGASTDGTLELLQAHSPNPGTLRSGPDKGIYDALNKGIALATGDVVGFLHADDLYAHPQVLEHIAGAFKDPAVCAVYGDLLYVRKHDITRVVRHWHSSRVTSRRLAWGWMPPHPTLYVRRSHYQAIGGFDTRYRISADYLSILQLFKRPGFKSIYLPEVLVKMRLGGASNRSLNALIRKTKEDWRALRQMRTGFVFGIGALACKNLFKLTQFRF